MSETTVSTVHLFEGIPNQEAAREYLVELRRPDRIDCPHCGSDKITAHKRKMDRLLHMPVLQGRVHGQDRDDFRAVACQAAHVDLWHVSRCHGEEGHFAHAVRQGNWCNSNDFKACVATHPRGMR